MRKHNELNTEDTKGTDASALGSHQSDRICLRNLIPSAYFCTGYNV
jgi:hypothetical protein